MPYKLKNGIYSVRCRYPRCSFHTQIEIERNLAGMTQKDVEDEAKKMVRDMAMIKHDAIHATRHTLRNPEIRKVSGSYELIGATPGAGVPNGEDSSVRYRDFQKGEIVLKKGEDATAVCEVISGYAYPLRNKNHRYNAGDCFGAAALVAGQSRTADIVAGSGKTRVAFYNIIELSKQNPKKARYLFNQVMDDTFKVIRDLEFSIDKLEHQIVKETVRG
jgi:hypothetical protein